MLATLGLWAEAHLGFARDAIAGVVLCSVFLVLSLLNMIWGIQGGPPPTTQGLRA